ncbi:hypothetical protein R1sor_022609 [Riccia sorocarpa]|uniref:Reverse transcriptase zinc-binding domain-containing protein n=1 Tax=Riccia sorocarpa TaxID=122646 RepID=A0ABD3GKE1_9MARC
MATTIDRFQYPGVLTGVDIVEAEIIDDLKHKYEARLKRWSTKLLSWPEKIILAQTILRTLPNYTLMRIGMSKLGIKFLEKITREFLWGQDSTGRNKKPLISWNTLTRRKKDGGLGWPKMEHQADAFVLKHVVKLAGGWHWEGQLKNNGNVWGLTSRQWRKLLYCVKDETDILNNRWGLVDNKHQWKQRWDYLWEGSAFTRLKLRLWRVLRKGYFKTSKVKNWKLDNGICMRCEIEMETIDHALWDCPRLLKRQRWISWLMFQEQERQTSTWEGEKLFTVADKALQQHLFNLAPLTLLSNVLRINWAERNDSQFNGRNSYMGIQHALLESKLKILAMRYARHQTDEHKLILQNSMATILFWEDETLRWMKGETTRNQMRNNYLQIAADYTGRDSTPLIAAENLPTIYTEWEEKYMIHCQADENSSAPQRQSDNINQYQDDSEDQGSHLPTMTLRDERTPRTPFATFSTRELNMQT